MQDLNCDLMPVMTNDDWVRLEFELAQTNLDWLISQVRKTAASFFEGLDAMQAGLDLEFLLSIAAEIANCPLAFVEDEKTELAQKPNP